MGLIYFFGGVAIIAACLGIWGWKELHSSKIE